MKFGVFYVLEARDGDFRRAWEEMLEQISLADELGFDTVWLAEHHGSTYGTMPSPQVAAAAVAMHTTRMRIGIAVSILPFDNPLRIAEYYAMVDVISNGRLDFGVGRGYQPREFRMLGMGDKQAHSRELFRESLDIVLGAWQSDDFSYAGKHYHVENVNLIPKPVQRPHPPVYMAAISPESFKIAAEKGLQLMVTPTLMTMDELKENVLVAQKEMAALGADPAKFDFPMNWQMHIAESGEAAKAATADALGWYFEKVMALVPQGDDTPPGYERYAELAAQFKAQGTVDVEGLREGGIILLDDPKTAIEKITALNRDIGQKQISCWMRIGGLENAKVKSSIKRFAEEVIPACRDL